MTKTYSKAELSALITETRQQIQELLKSETEDVFKAEAQNLAPEANGGKISKEEDKAEKKDDKGSSDSDSSASDAPPSGDDSSADAPPTGDASSAPPGDASAGAPPAGDPASADPAASAGSAGGDPMQTLVAAYSQLPPEALKAHFMALKQVISQQAGATDPAASAGGAPMDPASAGAPPADPASASPGPGAAAPLAGENSQPIDPNAQMAMKNEKELFEKLNKSEAARLELEKKVETLTKGMSLILRKPERKALRGKDVAGFEKSEPVAVDVTKLSKSELNKKLSEVARSPDLKKSDRELINGYFNHKVKVEDLQALFKK